MIDEGAVEEVKKLLTLNLNSSLPIMRAHGVPEIAKYLASEISLEECINKRTIYWIKNIDNWWTNIKMKIFYDCFV